MREPPNAYKFGLRPERRIPVIKYIAERLYTLFPLDITVRCHYHLNLYDHSQRTKRYQRRAKQLQILVCRTAHHLPIRKHDPQRPHPIRQQPVSQRAPVRRCRDRARYALCVDTTKIRYCQAILPSFEVQIV